MTFHLVHRSQRDPLVADESAPQRVLVPVAERQQDKTKSKTKQEIEKQKEEQKKYGVFFDDDYNYLQHLAPEQTADAKVEFIRVEKSNQDKKRTEKDQPKINLPSSVFESNVEEKVGLLNKVPILGPRPDLDPDVVAALDDDFNYSDPENELEDNFIELANAEGAEGIEYDGKKFLSNFFTLIIKTNYLEFLKYTH